MPDISRIRREGRFPRSRGMQGHVCLALLVAGLACGDSTGPKVRLAQVYAIEVPASVASNDTLTIGFRYALGCDILDHIDVSQTLSGITFAIWVTNRDVWCFDALVAQEGSHVQLVLPPRYNPFTVRFRQTPRDSVVVITTVPANP